MLLGGFHCFCPSSSFEYSNNAEKLKDYAEDYVISRLLNDSKIYQFDWTITVLLF